MVRSIRQSLTLFLLALLPFHAFFVTFWTKILAGPGHAPLAVLAVWKEALLAVVLFLAIVEILSGVRKKAVVSGQWSVTLPKLDLLDLLILALLGLSLLPATSYPLPATRYLLGFKYDFVPLIAFLILRRVSWAAAWKRTVLLMLLLVSVAVAVMGLSTLPLPQGVFTMLGYSPVHSTYIPSGPIAAFQLLSDTGLRRIQSTFGGPNQFGIYLLLPWSIGVLAALGALRSPLVARTTAKQLHHLLPLLHSPNYLFAIGIAGTLFFTYSRSAWIGAVVIAVTAWILLRPSPSTEQAPSRRPARLPEPVEGRAGLLRMTLGVLSLSSILFFLSPGLLLRPTSSSAHLSRPWEALNIIIEEPYGRGLGSAGPAQHRVSDVCLHYPLGSDTRWAKARPDLCVFRGGIQVQPRERECHCPVIPENWYLQIGMELGVIGLILYLTFLTSVLRTLFVNLKPSNLQPSTILFAVTSLFLLGVSVAGLFLHSFEDSAVAYTAWTLAAVVLSKKR